MTDSNASPTGAAAVSTSRHRGFVPYSAGSAQKFERRMPLLAANQSSILFAMALVLVSMAIANYVGWIRLHPEIQATAWFDTSDYNPHVVVLFQRAVDRAHGGIDAWLPIYDTENPGLFMLVSELFVRAGATTPLPLEILSIVLYNVGAVCFFFWVYLLFGDLIAAAFATAFLTLSQFFLAFSGVAHTFPYEFFFFNVTLLLYVGYLRNNRRAYLVSSLVVMFLTCMNYWMYYISTWMIMLGLWWQFRGRPGFKQLVMFSTPPIAAAVLTVLLVMVGTGGFWNGGVRLLDMLAARTIDARIPGGSWFPHQKFMTAADWPTYPSWVKYRLQWAFDFDLHSYAIAAAFTGALMFLRRSSSLVSALILLVGGMSWYYVMFQHTFIHHFAGQYGFMAICPIFGLIASEAVASSSKSREIWNTAFGAAGRERTYAWLQILAATAFVTTACFFVGRTYGLVKETIVRSYDVEAKYQQAVQDICKLHSEVTLADLKSAAKDWGFEWQPEELAESNRMPKC